MYAYVYTHKDAILRNVETEFKANYNGHLHIENIKPNLWKKFPNICFEIQGLSIKDDQFLQHRQPFLKAKNVYLQLRILPLFLGNVKIGKITFSHGTLIVFEDINGVSNKNIFKKKTTLPISKNHRAGLRFEIEDFEIKIINLIRKKDFQFYFDFLQGQIDEKAINVSVKLKGKALIKNLCFNTGRGSYFKGKSIDLNMSLAYWKQKQIIQIVNQKVIIADQNLLINGVFILKPNKSFFKLNFVAKELDYREAVSWMSPPIATKLDSFILEKPIFLDVTIEGRLKHQRNPHVRLNSVVVNNKMLTRFGRFDAINFVACYDNGRHINTLFGDENSAITIKKLTAKYKGIEFATDSASVYNFKSPELKATIHSVFELKKLNQVFAKQTFQFGKGVVSINLNYKGQLLKNTTQIEDVDGEVSIRNADVTYLPRKIKFHNSNLHLRLLNQDIVLLPSDLHTTQNNFIVSAFAKDFFLHYKADPNKVVFDASLTSPSLNLIEFQTFFVKRTAVELQKSKAAKLTMPDAIDKVFENAHTDLDIKIGQLNYKKFSAQNIAAQLSFLKDKILLKSAQLQYASGSINCSGSLSDHNPNNTLFMADATMNNVALNKLLYGFGSFGQTTFLPENIIGSIYLQTHLEGIMDSNAVVRNTTLKGNVSFEISDGELLHFKPLMRLGKMLFGKKRVDTVKFKKMSNHLLVNGNEITIPRMDIQTSLINMRLEGVFNMKVGSDLRMEIPLFEKDKMLWMPNAAKGYSVYVHGIDDAAGRMQFKWNLKNQEIADARAAAKKQRRERKNIKILK